MRYQNIIPATFLARPNRFVAEVMLADGAVAVCHVKNTGRCRELLIPGVRVWLEVSANPARKTAYDLVAVEKGERLVNMDAQAPNRVFGEWAAESGVFGAVTAVRPEFRYGASRLDFCLETDRGRCLVEVKGVTLENNGHARFPDAPTERGVRHIRELQAAVADGLDAAICFVIQMENIHTMRPNDETHPAFGDALREAAASGVRVMAWECAVTPERLSITRPVPVIL